MSEIHIPTTNPDQDEGPEQKLAVHVDPEQLDDDADPDPATIADQHWDGDEEFNPDQWTIRTVPADVAEELGLEHGDTLEVHQEEILHHDEAKMGRRAADPEEGIHPMALLQEVIDGSVTDSNFRIHPPEEDHRKDYEQVKVQEMGTPSLAWFLHRWLGSNRALHHLVSAGGEIERRKKKS